VLHIICLPERESPVEQDATEPSCYSECASEYDGEDRFSTVEDAEGEDLETQRVECEYCPSSINGPIVVEGQSQSKVAK
jgi:hypothetical protein